MNILFTDSVITIPDEGSDTFLYVPKTNLYSKKKNFKEPYDLWPKVSRNQYSNITHLKYIFSIVTHKDPVLTEAIFNCYKYSILKNFNNKTQEMHFLKLSEFKTLLGENFIHASILDSWMICKISNGEWKNISFFPTDTSLYIVGKDCQKLHNDNFFIYHLNEPFKNLVFVPYYISSHCQLIVLNISTKQIFNYDPKYEYTTDGNLKFFINYLKKCKRINSESNNPLLKIKNWEIVKTKHNMPIQKDGYNCASYIINYMDIIAKTSSNLHNAFRISQNFNPDYHRVLIANYLIQNSMSLQGVCLGCTNQSKILKYRCNLCLRESHDGNCLKNFFDSSKCCKFCKESLEFITPVRNNQTMHYSLNDNTRIIGFPNENNSCWLNATLQSILRLSIFNTENSWIRPDCSKMLQWLLNMKNKLFSRETRPNEILLLLRYKDFLFKVAYIVGGTQSSRIFILLE